MTHDLLPRSTVAFSEFRHFWSRDHSHRVSDTTVCKPLPCLLTKARDEWLRERPQFPLPRRFHQTAKYKVELNEDALLHSVALFYCVQLQVPNALVACLCWKMQRGTWGPLCMSPPDVHKVKVKRFDLCLWVQRLMQRAKQGGSREAQPASHSATRPSSCMQCEDFIFLKLHFFTILKKIEIKNQKVNLCINELYFTDIVMLEISLTLCNITRWCRTLWASLVNIYTEDNKYQIAIHTYIYSAN